MYNTKIVFFLNGKILTMTKKDIKEFKVCVRQCQMFQFSDKLILLLKNLSSNSLILIYLP